MTIKTIVISSLEKVFADEELRALPVHSASALNNEVFSFQVAFKSDGSLMKNVSVQIDSELKSYIEVRSVGLVPSEFPIYHDHDDNILRNKAGLFPDPLYPIDSEGLTLFPKQWRSIWLTVHLHENIKPGSYPIHIHFKNSEGNTLAEESFQLEVLPALLPEQTLIHTQWFHTDSIMDQYDVEVFSEDYWYWVEKYIQTAVNHGINMLLTPLFTPPLDAEIGKERPTVQLVDVKKVEGEYTFQFDKLLRWVETGLRNGLKYFEFSHLFTQWGAHHAPKIIAEVDGEVKKVFGWETQADSEEYVTFLSRFLPELKSFIYVHNLEEKVYFHVSDEPMLEHMDSYRHARDIMQKHLDEFPIMDALSDYAFYKNGLVKRPIPATDHIEPFLEHNVPDLWTYYCCAQYKDVANRFFTFPSARNRIIGLQLYKYNIKGFLQWGYNFWFSQLSKKSINPFKNTDAGYGFPSGDAFIVYPGKNEPIESIRMEVFYDALQDMRALQLLEGLIGKEGVIDLIHEELNTPLTFKEYPRESEWLLDIREKVNKRIVKEIQK